VECKRDADIEPPLLAASVGLEAIYEPVGEMDEEEN
jgi:hypothetical protein